MGYIYFKFFLKKLKLMIDEYLVYLLSIFIIFIVHLILYVIIKK